MSGPRTWWYLLAFIMMAQALSGCSPIPDMPGPIGIPGL